MKTYQIHVLNTPPNYMIKLKLDSVTTEIVTTEAKNKKQALKYFISLGIDCCIESIENITIKE